MFHKTLVPFGIVLILVSAIAGSMFRFGSIYEMISLAEPMVHIKSHESGTTLGWTVEDFRKLCGLFGPEVEIKSVVFDQNANTATLTFRNGNILKLGHVYLSSVVSSVRLYSEHSDQDRDTMAQIALLICATADGKKNYREVCNHFIGEASSCMFGRPGQAIHFGFLEIEGIAYRATNPVVFTIRPKYKPRG